MIQKEFTTQFIKENCGCYSQERLKALYIDNKTSGCFEDLLCTVSLDEIIESNIPLKDKYWFLCRKVLNKEQNQHIAIGIAEIVLFLYEEKYPNNRAPREAIQGAKAYAAGIINIDELINKRANAFAAYYAATDAADYAAATAVNAVNAAYAVADITEVPDLQQTLLQYLKEFYHSLNE